MQQVAPRLPLDTCLQTKENASGGATSAFDNKAWAFINPTFDVM